MTRRADLNVAAERLVAWLRPRAGAWLTTSDHQLARVAGMLDADAGMVLLDRLAALGLVEVQHGPLQRVFRFLSDAPAPFAPPAAPADAAPARPALPPITPEEPAMTNPTPSSRTGSVIVYPTPAQRERLAARAATAGQPIAGWIGEAIEQRLAHEPDEATLGGQARLRPLVIEAGCAARDEGVDVWVLLAEVIGAGLTLRRSARPAKRVAS